MKRIFSLSVIVVLVAVVAAATVGGVTSRGSAEADGFDNSSLEGPYGFVASGDIVAPNPLAGPATEVGLVTFDGAGGCTVSDTVNFAVLGVVARASVSCTYSVASDGSGTLTPTFGPPFGTIPIAFVIVDDEDEFRFMRTTATERISGVAKRQ